VAMLGDASSSGGVYKSAVLLASLGTDLAARVLSHLDDRQVEALIRKMAQLGRIRAEERDQVLTELNDSLDEDSGEPAVGVEYARRMLEQAMGPEKASRIIGEIVPQDVAPPTLATILETTAPKSLAALVEDEHPQLIALLIGQLSVEMAAACLSALPAEVRAPVAARLVEMEAPAPIALHHLERCLRDKLQGAPSLAAEQPGAGPRRVADILGQMRRSVESHVLASLEQQSPLLAQKVHQYRFSFEDVLALEARSLQRVLRDVESDTLRIAMKGLDEEQQQTIYSNMSERAAARLREELENSGPAQAREVELAQQTIVGVARALRESGEIQSGVTNASEEEEEDAVV
jgi:flagellar motor switch protein FliG